MSPTQLILISQKKFNNQIKQTINARDLHSFLEVQSRFADWIKNRIEKYDFTENDDYIKVSKILETYKGYQIDYFLTLEMAKELSMVENNEKGRQARKYFIEKEKEANEKQIVLPANYKEALKSLIYKIEEKERLQIEFNKQEDTLKNISQVKNCYGLRETAKKLAVQEKNLKHYLQMQGWSMYLDGNINPTAYATKNNFALISHELNKQQGKFYPQFKITQKGFEYLAKNRHEIINK